MLKNFICIVFTAIYAIAYSQKEEMYKGFDYDDIVWSYDLDSITTISSLGKINGVTKSFTIVLSTYSQELKKYESAKINMTNWDASYLYYRELHKIGNKIYRSRAEKTDNGYQYFLDKLTDDLNFKKSFTPFLEGQKEDGYGPYFILKNISVGCLFYIEDNSGSIEKMPVALMDEENLQIIAKHKLQFTKKQKVNQVNVGKLGEENVIYYDCFDPINKMRQVKLLSINKNGFTDYIHIDLIKGLSANTFIFNANEKNYALGIDLLKTPSLELHTLQNTNELTNVYKLPVDYITQNIKSKLTDAEKLGKVRQKNITIDVNSDIYIFADLYDKEIGDLLIIKIEKEEIIWCTLINRTESTATRYQKFKIINSTSVLEIRDVELNTCFDNEGKYIEGLANKIEKNKSKFTDIKITIDKNTGEFKRELVK